MAQKLVWDEKKKAMVWTTGSTKARSRSDIEIEHLLGQNKHLDQRVEKLGGEKKKGGNSIFDRVMDVVSRPSYAVAEGIASALDKGKRGGVGGSLLDAAVGVGRGLSGTKKTSNIQTLQEHGVKGPLSVGLGLAGDIFLDPTTYLTGGVSAAGSAARASVKGSAAFSDAYKIAKTSKAVKASARADALAEATAAYKAGGALKISGKELIKRSQELINQNALDTARTAQRVAEGANSAAAGRVTLKAFGKEIAGSEGLYRGIRQNRVTKALVNSAPVQELNKKFRTTGTYGADLNDMRRLNESGGVFRYDELLNPPQGHTLSSGTTLKWDDVDKMLTAKEAKAFSRAYELGDISALGATSSKGLKYADLEELVTTLNKQMWDSEVERGMYKYARHTKSDKATGITKGDIVHNADGTPKLENEPINNYLHHYYKGGDKAKISQFKSKRKAVAGDTHAPALERQIKTFSDAEAAGLKVEDDIRLIMRNRTAKHARSIARRSFLDDAVKNFGVPVSDKATLAALKADGHKLENLKATLKQSDADAYFEKLDDDVYMPSEIVEKLKGVSQMADDPGEFLKLADTVIRKWKAGATVYNPGHHVRNFMSDLMLNYMDGVKDPKVYGQAFAIVQRVKDPNKLVKLKKNVKVGGMSIDELQLHHFFKESGAAPGFIRTEVDGQGIGSQLLRTSPSRVAHGFSEGREETARLAHFIDAFKKEAKGVNSQEGLAEAAKRAGDRVKKWNIDYADLTDFEKAKMKRVIPFYTWMRKSSPLMIEAMVLRPGKVANINKTFNAMEQLLGVDPSEALPQDMIPKWLREGPSFQIGDSSRGNPMFINAESAIPFAGTLGMGEGGKEGVMSNLLSAINPLARIPIEQATGRQIFSGAPVPGALEYAANQLPAARLGHGLLNGSDDPTKNTGLTKLLNWGTGAGLHEVTPNSIKGEQRRQMDPKEAFIKEARKNQREGQQQQLTQPGKKLVWDAKQGKMVWR